MFLLEDYCVYIEPTGNTGILGSFGREYLYGGAFFSWKGGVFFWATISSFVFLESSETAG